MGSRDHIWKTVSIDCYTCEFHRLSSLYPTLQASWYIGRAYFLPRTSIKQRVRRPRCLGYSCELSSSDNLFGFRSMMAAILINDSALTARSSYDALSLDVHLFPDSSVEPLRLATNSRDHEGVRLAGYYLVLVRIYTCIIFLPNITCER